MPDPYSVEEFWKGQEKFLHVVGTKKGRWDKTFQFILILINMAEDLLCMY